MPSESLPVTFSVLQATALSKVLQKYNLTAPVSCQFWHSGLNQTYRVSAGKKTFFLRLYRYGWRSRDEILAEVDMLSYLHNNRLPVAYPVCRKDGAYLNRVTAPEGSRYAVLFSAATGNHPRMNDRNCRTYGELVVRIHSCLDRRKRDSRRFHIGIDHLVHEPLQAIEPFLKHRRKDLNYLCEVGTALAEKVESTLPRTKPAYGSCHGDHHYGNLHIDGNGVMTLFDFDCYGYGWRAYDICLFLVFLQDQVGLNLTKGQKSSKTRRWNAFLQGCESVRKLHPTERESIYLFAPLRHIWLLGLHTQGADIWGRSFLDESYFDFRIGFIRHCVENYRLL